MEAAIASQNGIAVERVVARVTLDRSNPAAAMFRSEVEFEGELTAEQRAKLHQVASACPVRRTLMRAIRLEDASD